MNSFHVIRFLSTDILKIVDEIYGEDPTLSMVYVSKKLNVNDKTVARAVRDLGM